MSGRSKGWFLSCVSFGFGVAVSCSFLLTPGRHTASQASSWLSRVCSAHLALHNTNSTPDNENGISRPFGIISSESEVEAGEATEDMELDDEYCSVVDDFGCEAYEEISLTDGEENNKPRRWVRIEAGPDRSLRNIETQEDVIKKIREVRQEQSKFGRADLYRRPWTPVEDLGLINGEAADSAFSVLQFNALAEGLSAGPSVQTPFTPDSTFDKNKTKNNSFGGFTEVQSPEVSLDFSLRRWRLLEVMLEQGAFFDIIALEEVDRFHGFFRPILRLFGYDGVFMPKIRAPGFSLGWYSDGCALFWKRERFKLVSERRLVYRAGTQVLVVATLQHIQSQRHLVVAVTHLKARKNEENERVRCEQVKELLGHVGEEVDAVTSLTGDQVPVLIMGDFNADPPSQVEGSDSCVSLVMNHGSDTENGTRRFSSAYPIDPPESGYFTTWKTRGEETVKRVIDYIFYSKELSCSHTLSIPDMGQDQLPGLRYPSDHLMIAAQFQFRDGPNSTRTTNTE